MTYQETIKIMQNEQRCVQKQSKAILMSIKTLEKQIAYYPGDKFVGTCKCGKKVYPHMSYCDGCGQKLTFKEKEI